MDTGARTVICFATRDAMKISVQSQLEIVTYVLRENGENPAEKHAVKTAWINFALNIQVNVINALREIGELSATTRVLGIFACLALKRMVTVFYADMGFGDLHVKRSVLLIVWDNVMCTVGRVKRAYLVFWDPCVRRNVTSSVMVHVYKATVTVESAIKVILANNVI